MRHFGRCKHAPLREPKRALRKGHVFEQLPDRLGAGEHVRVFRRCVCLAAASAPCRHARCTLCSPLSCYFQRQAELARQGVISNSAIGLFGTEVTDVPR
jgi:hypothetical protein